MLVSRCCSQYGTYRHLFRKMVAALVRLNASAITLLARLRDRRAEHDIMSLEVFDDLH